MKTKRGSGVLTAGFLIYILFVSALGIAAPEKADTESILKEYGRLPLYFIENKGQLDSKVRFYAKTPAQTLYFTNEGIVFDLIRGQEDAANRPAGAEKGHQTRGAKRDRLVFNLQLLNAQKGVLVEGLELQAGTVNYFVGKDRGKWRTGIPTFEGIIYRGIYGAIDLKVYGNGQGIKYEFVVNTGGNPNDILLTYNGIDGLATNGEGELLIETAFGQLKETRPYIYQEIAGKRVVDGDFVIRSPAYHTQTGTFSYGFKITSYDPSYPLIIDLTLSYSTYLGGSDWWDRGYGIVVDVSGNAYITGSTKSIGFPTENPYQGMVAGADDAFITKLASSGSVLSYSTYLGGSADDIGNGIAVDGSGNAYVTGETASSDFPTQNPYQGNLADGRDIFITKLASSGSVLSYSTYLGGSDDDIGNGIAVDGSGNAYVTGETASSDFPTQNPYQGIHADGRDVFITKLASSGSALTYSTYLGGNSLDTGNGIAVDGSGNAYVTGVTGSSDFPTQSPFQGEHNGEGDAFAAKFNSSGSALTYSTYLGGNGLDTGNGIAVDGSGNAYVTGVTYSADFPTQNPYQGDAAGLFSDAFVTKLTSSGSVLSYSTYLGGDGSDEGNGVAVDASGNAYITGKTGSSDFPTQNPYQGAFAGIHSDAFVTKLTSSGSVLSYSTYLGGDGSDEGNGIAVDGSGNAYVTGETASSDFPTQAPFQGSLAGGYDAFVTKLNSLFVTTQGVADIGTKTATGNGYIMDLGSPNPTQHGVCWSITGTPTIADSKTEEGAAIATGAFTTNMRNLLPNTLYYVRAYAKNSAAVSYGGAISFTTALLSSILYVNKSDETCAGNSPCHASIQAALDAATSGSFIRVASGTYTETLALEASKSLTIQGGWDSAFSSQSPRTTFIEAPKVTKGSLKLQELVVQP